MRYRRAFSQVTAFFLAVAILFSGLLVFKQVRDQYVSQYPQSSPELLIDIGKHVDKLSPVLKVQAFDSEGNLKAEVIKEDDLILNNFKYFLLTWMNGWIDEDGDHVLKDVDNQGRTVRFRDESTSGSGTSQNTFCYYGTNAGGWMAIGEGSTSPTVIDYDCETIYSSREPISTNSNYNSTTGIISIVHQFSITDTVTISEVVLGTHWQDNPGGTWYYFAHFRDTFSGIGVENGDTLSVSYYIDLDDTGFTDNFGLLLAGILASSTSSRSVSLTDINGDPRTTYITSSTDNTLANWIFTEGIPSSYYQIGTYSTATSRDDYCLVGQVEDDSPDVQTYLISGDLWIQGNVYCDEARAIQEVGFFMRFYNDIDWSFMIFRDTFTVANIEADTWINVKCVIGMLWYPLRVFKVW